MKTTQNSGSKDTTLSFSREDIDLLSDTVFFEKKRKLLANIIDRFSVLEKEYQNLIPDFPGAVPFSTDAMRGKISKGENYRGLPYLLLDFPAIFQKHSIYAFRTMFWWGHGFSFTFHVSGEFLQPLLIPFNDAIKNDIFNDYLICINEDQWEHHFNPSNYLSVNNYKNGNHNFVHDTSNKGFLKITKRLPTENSESLLTDGISFMRTILRSSR